ncbi:MAG: transposase [Gemmataceae bacterium]|nr:transposase [Gemmataceae bacterium]
MQPVKAFTTTRRNLPHWQDPGAVYFLTWRAMPGRLLEEEDRALALGAIHYWDGSRWDVYAAVVMPDHVHALARPLPLTPGDLVGRGHYSLSDLLKSVKNYSSTVINRRQGRRGSFWQDETYDRIMRDESEFEEKWGYIRNNPVEAGLVAVPEEYPWLYERTRSE